MRKRKSDIPDSIKTIAINIKRIIKEKELKTTEVAIESQIDIETFRRYIGGSNPSIVMGTDKLVRIAKALKIEDYNELFKGV
ncbi:MAG: hypothetical protein RBR78_10830 [Flavobacteriaceae bacterium]|jgi:predicted transcriptional regulator|nr:hypothetical protein [Flavobacteriaceae bacterium]